MDLSEARAIKSMALSAVESAVADTALTRMLQPPEAIFGQGAELPHMAVGIAEVARGYRLQARIQQLTPVTSQALELLQSRSRGEVDIVEIGPVHALSGSSAARKRPLERGVSLARVDGDAGTLGAFVHTVGVRSQLFLLSNNHVLAQEGRARAGDEIRQPAPVDGGGALDGVARLTRWIELTKGVPNRVDAAIAAIEREIDVDLAVPGRVTGVAERAGGTVEKVGRSSGATQGTVTAFEVDNVVVTYPSGAKYRFDGQTEVAGADGRFSEPGDSGALITSGSAALGLVFAGSSYGGPKGHGITYANSISSVLTALDIEFAS